MMTGAQFLERRVRRDRISAQQLGEPRVGRVLVDPVTGHRTATIPVVVGTSHPAASSQPCDPRADLTYRRV
ncbi:hypothetical protein GCM10010244_55720 [Streptomyces coeruleorubidus]|nr:hypothetical protein GCM10010244_55720 [Streptomyces bellus]